MRRAQFAEWVVMLVSCSHQDPKIEVSNEFEKGFLSEAHDASLEGCGCKNSKMKLPSQRWKGPEMTGSSRALDFAGIIPSWLG